MGSMVGAGRNSGWQPPSAPVPKAMVESAAKAAGHGWRVGQGVFHTKFGEGVIVTLEGAGEDARAQVNFGRHGPKWLALAMAKLTAVD
jgi:DNA helicase-2/ATP-dependent DNA helicase PcrA